MLAPFATLAFLTTLWLIGFMILPLMGDNGRKVAAALKGRSVLATEVELRLVAVRVSQRPRAQQSLHAQPQWRAAA
ncbi:MAG: hypothetical protein ABI626_04960 [Sphingomicrobium sp.]